MLSKRARELNDSITIAVSTLAKELQAKGKDIIALSAGEPDFDTDKIIKEAAIKAIERGCSKYTPVAGENELLQAIATKFKKDNNLDYDISEIIASTGAKQCLFNAILALVDEGDEVLIPVPYWVSYPEIVSFAGGKNVFLQADEDFKINADTLKAAITPKTKLLILNLPSNPSGVVYNKEELTALAKVLEGTDIQVISDEIYEKLLFDGRSFHSFASVSQDAYKRCLVINGLSKCAAMPGWRFGYAASKNAKLNNALRKIQSQSSSNMCSIVQHAAIPALLGRSDEYVEFMKNSYERRRDLVCELLKDAKGLKYKKCDGAFYLFINHKDIAYSSLDFTKALLEEVGVALVPGIGFGMEGYSRLSFATSDELLSKACRRIIDFCNK